MEELTPALAHRRRVGDVLVIHLVDQPTVGADGSGGFVGHRRRSYRWRRRRRTPVTDQPTGTSSGAVDRLGVADEARRRGLEDVVGYLALRDPASVVGPDQQRWEHGEGREQGHGHVHADDQTEVAEQRQVRGRDHQHTGDRSQARHDEGSAGSCGGDVDRLPRPQPAPAFLEIAQQDQRRELRTRRHDERTTDRGDRAQLQIEGVRDERRRAHGDGDRYQRQQRADDAAQSDRQEQADEQHRQVRQQDAVGLEVLQQTYAHDRETRMGWPSRPRAVARTHGSHRRSACARRGCGRRTGRSGSARPRVC